MRTAGIVTVPVLLVACANGGDPRYDDAYRWDKKGVSAQQAEDDDENCRGRPRGAPPFVQQQGYVNCMSKLGYKWVRNKK